MVGAFLAGVTLLTVVTGYSPSAGGTNCSYSGRCDVTASGLAPGPGRAACGPAWELGAYLVVEGHGIVLCADRFGRPPAPHAVDLWFARKQDALVHGRQMLRVRPLRSFDEVRHDPCRRYSLCDG